MKKILPILLVGILVISGFGAVAIPGGNENKPFESIETICFSDPVIIEEKQNIRIEIENANSYLSLPGYPLLPSYIKTYTFPFGTSVKNIDVTFSESKEYDLEKKIVSSPTPVTFVNGAELSAEIKGMPSDVAVYPENQYSYTISAGIDGEKHVIFLTVRCYPVQYMPSKNAITCYSDANIKVAYKPPESQVAFHDEYDMIIVAPSEFLEKLQPLVDHKNSHGISTILIENKDISDGTYFPVQGRDCAEKMKYFIKNAIENWGINYVLLVGGRFGGVFHEKWWIPVRYSHLNDGGEGSFIADLYFADIYKYNDETGYTFDDWDSNENGVFAEWTQHEKDILDMAPDVFLGRLPCRSDSEVEVMVSKIINYEENAYGSDWFNRMVVVGGDSAPGYKYYEGEEENKKALEYMQGFEATKLWTSDGSLSGVTDVVNAISGGCGFLFFDGHGNPSTWGTHPPDDNETWITGLDNSDMAKLENGEKLPVTVVGGCHNGQFNVSPFNIIKGILEHGLKGYFFGPPYLFYHMEWVPECWAWSMASKVNGGAIAIMAYTGLDWFAEGDYDNDSIPDCTQYFSGYANTHFFKNYGQNNMTTLGQAHTQTLVDYISEHPVDWEMDWKDEESASTLIDCKTVQEFVLMGDPSLQIGGYL